MAKRRIEEGGSGLEGHTFNISGGNQTFNFDSSAQPTGLVPARVRPEVPQGRRIQIKEKKIIPAEAINALTSLILDVFNDKQVLTSDQKSRNDMVDTTITHLEAAKKLREEKVTARDAALAIILANALESGNKYNLNRQEAEDLAFRLRLKIAELYVQVDKNKKKR